MRLVSDRLRLRFDEVSHYQTGTPRVKINWDQSLAFGEPKATTRAGGERQGDWGAKSHYMEALHGLGWGREMGGLGTRGCHKRAPHSLGSTHLGLAELGDQWAGTDGPRGQNLFLAKCGSFGPQGESFYYWKECIYTVEKHF